MNPIFQALNQGYSNEEVISFLSKAIPQFSKPISKAKQLGYSVNEILGFLSKMTTQRSASFAQQRQNESEMIKHGLKLGATLGGSALLANAGKNVLSRALPSILGQNIGQPTQNIPNVPGGSDSNLPGSKGAEAPLPNVPIQTETPLDQNIGQNIGQPEQNLQPKLPEISPIKDISSILEKTKTKDMIDRLAKSGNGSKEISAYFNKFSPKHVKEIEKESGKSFDETISDYLSQGVQNQSKEIEQTQEVEEVKPMKVGNTVITPHGIGNVKALREGQSIVEIDGKKHKIDEDDLMDSPLPEKDLASLYDDLISGIEKDTGKEVSRWVDFASYDAKRNALAVMPHGGNFFLLENIPEDKVDKLKNLLHQRKGSGETFIGSYEKGTKSPIGSQLSLLIHELMGSKKSPYSQPNLPGIEFPEPEKEKGFETIYRAFEPAIEASEKKFKDKKLAERLEKKRLKEEEKRRIDQERERKRRK